MLLKIGFNNQPLNPFVQIKFSKFSSIDSTWDHFTFNSNLINPTITKRNLESLMINETHRSNINKTSPFDYGNANSRNKLKCLSSPPPINVYPGWKNWTSGVRERERERADLGNHKQPDPLKYEEWYHPSTRGVIFKHADSSTMKKRPRA